ncbi:MAG: prolipoprotein diacylglyceryl transferase [Chlamydiales bacterium]
MNSPFFAHFYWDPHPIMFTLPYLNWPIRWYGVLFALGFGIAYFMIVKLFRREGIDKASSSALADRLCWYVVIGTVLGARLGHIVFYDLEYHLIHPIEILKTWNGGLASHGGVVGILIALSLFYRKLREQYPQFTFMRFLDIFAIPVPFVATLIRCGNFINQEIIGTTTTVPWGIIFGHPYDGIHNIPHHPVQLYEAVAYFFTFMVLLSLYRFRKKLGEGAIAGWMFVLIFGSRFIIEFYKSPLGGIADDLPIQTGQVLSIPCLLAGVYLIFQSYRKKEVSNPASNQIKI